MPHDAPDQTAADPGGVFSSAIITPRGLGGAVVFGIGLATMAVLPVGLVLWAAGSGTLLLIVGAIALLPGAGLMAAGGYLMYRSLRPRPAPSATADAARTGVAAPHTDPAATAGPHISDREDR
ncbi:hypothetical protein [Mycetocola reblochoni]|uniref:Uncharacterized protein n=2 Tax=Mycetocola reblochoni TaxID=331618 RepID=A0A1R4IX59_9MICO|nr:hypothetical protein [Mycetocola reblochoni]RLP70948.1 hypothetical protein D9V30_00510 [Mycetocola reblochoni]SJN24279.1 hypothetical protein FM119_04120 [Mycetocola reblochoni REB411]